jgi:hypothetical protein
MVGDLNWKPAYTKILPMDWGLALNTTHQPTTTLGTNPTRCITRLTTAKVTDLELIQGIPLHKLVNYNVELPTRRRRPIR